MEGINRIKEYFLSMEMYQGKWVVCVKFRPKWGAYSSDDGRIKVGPDEKQQDVWWYCANDESVDVDEIIDLIDETAQTNMEAIKKVELFKLKAGELKQIFSDESISFSKLQTLKFVFSDDSIQPEPQNAIKLGMKKKSGLSSKKDLMNHVGEEIKEHNVLTDTVDDNKDITVTKAKGNRKRTTENPKNIGTVKTATPADMTQDEIDSLRG